MSNVQTQHKSYGKYRPVTRKCIPDFKYPDGKKMAVSFCLDYDSMLQRKLNKEPVQEWAKGEYGGRTGIWRFLEVWGENDIRGTLFTPGRICELFPDSIRAAAEQGHEIGDHMFEHRNPPEPDIQDDHVRWSTESLSSLSGQKIRGTTSRYPFHVLKKYGYTYVGVSNLAAELPEYAIDEDGDAMLVMPHNFILTDAYYFNFGYMGGKNAAQRFADPEHVYNLWLESFKYAYRNGKMFKVIMHDFEARAMRMDMLDRLIKEIKRYPGVWFTTCGEMADYCLKEFPLESLDK